MEIIKAGDHVRYLNREKHERAPGGFPAYGTVGVVAYVHDGWVTVQWPAGSTSDDDRWLAPLEDLVELPQEVEKVLETMRAEAVREIQRSSSYVGKLAWFWSHIGALDMARQLELITDERRQQLYNEFFQYKPEEN